MAEGEREQDPELERAGGDLPPEPPGITIPWRDLLAWAAAVFVVAWAAMLLPGIVADLRQRSGVEDADPETVLPEMPADPVLSEEVKEALRRGREAESAGQLVLARGYYYKAQRLEPRCFSCRLRRRVVERLINEECAEGLKEGARYLEEARFEEAAGQYRKVLGLVPYEKADYHLLAKQGLAEARKGAKAAGRPLP